jgi:hypothetical protein
VVRLGHHAPVVLGSEKGGEDVWEGEGFTLDAWVVVAQTEELCSGCNSSERPPESEKRKWTASPIYSPPSDSLLKEDACDEAVRGVVFLLLGVTFNDGGERLAVARVWPKIFFAEREGEL